MGYTARRLAIAEETNGRSANGLQAERGRRRTLLPSVSPPLFNISTRVYAHSSLEQDDLDLMTLRSLCKSSTMRSISKSAPPTRPSSPQSTAALLPAPLSFSDSGLQVPRSISPPPATEGMTALSPWSKGLRGTPQEAARRWTRRQEEARHHFVIWPIVAVLIVFIIVTIELQMVVNDVFEGENELDFPGALTLFLALPTVWAVIKALKRIQEGRRPLPQEREDETFEVRFFFFFPSSPFLSPY